jgi:hypothetical protein
VETHQDDDQERNQGNNQIDGDMKTYYVDINVNFSCRYKVEAETEEEARRKALDNVSQARNGCFVDVGVTDCFVDEETTKANNK